MFTIRLAMAGFAPINSAPRPAIWCVRKPRCPSGARLWRFETADTSQSARTQSWHTGTVFQDEIEHATSQADQKCSEGVKDSFGRGRPLGHYSGINNGQALAPVSSSKADFLKSPVRFFERIAGRFTMRLRHIHSRETRCA